MSGSTVIARPFEQLLVTKIGYQNEERKIVPQLTHRKMHGKNAHEKRTGKARDTVAIGFSLAYDC